MDFTPPPPPPGHPPEICEDGEFGLAQAVDGGHKLSAEVAGEFGLSIGVGGQVGAIGVQASFDKDREVAGNVPECES